MPEYIKFQHEDAVFLICIVRQCERSFSSVITDVSIPLVNVVDYPIGSTESWSRFCQYGSTIIIPSLNRALALLKTSITNKRTYSSKLYLCLHYFCKRKAFIFLQPDFISGLQKTLMVFLAFIENENYEIDLPMLEEFIRVRMQLTQCESLLEKYFWKKELSVIRKVEHYQHSLYKEFLPLENIVSTCQRSKKYWFFAWGQTVLVGIKTPIPEAAPVLIHPISSAPKPQVSDVISGEKLEVEQGCS